MAAQGWPKISNSCKSRLIKPANCNDGPTRNKVDQTIIFLQTASRKHDPASSVVKSHDVRDDIEIFVMLVNPNRQINQLSDAKTLDVRKFYE